jgi:general L-amino acid transport system substrate-binding protein
MQRALFAILTALLLAGLLAACGQQAPQQEATDAPAEEAPAATDAPATEEDAPTEEPAATVEPAATAPPAGGQETPSAGRLQTVIDRGSLICGVNNTLPGFGNVDSAGEFAGFDVDFCRAIAAAVLDDPTAVEFRPLTSQERFTALQTGEVDVLIRNTTWTLGRDGGLGLEFGPVTFYDGQGMMVRRDSGITTLEDMNGATVCVQTGTTTELNLADSFRARELEFTPLVFENNDQSVAAYDAGQCDGFTTDKSGLVSSLTLLANPEEHTILEVTMSKEPLGPSVLQGDPQWDDVMTWVTLATIQAEEFGITQDNLAEFLESDVPEIRRFLGLEGDLGQGIGLPNDFVQKVIQAVGNYGEIYDRHLGPDTPFDLPRGQNSLYTDGGLLYSPPFR